MRIFRWAVIAAVAAAVVTGLIISGSPGRERLRQFDRQRVADLQQISSAIDSYWSLNRRLPGSLDELVGKREFFVPSVRDPQTGEPYAYRLTGEKSYELCAAFVTASSEDPEAPRVPVPADSAPGFWSHGAGEKCFPIEVRVSPEAAPKPVIY